PGTKAAVWTPQGRITTTGVDSATFRRSQRGARVQASLRRVMTTQRPFWTPDLSNDPRLAETEGPVSLDGLEHRAVLVVPVRINDALLAILGVTSTAGRAFSETDVELVQVLADLAA